MNWGILGYGKIAPVFIESLNQLSTEKIVAAATRSGAERVKSELPGVKVYTNYEELYKDPEVDIIYISTTHNFHAEQSIRALENGKHVLCEKPIGTTLSETSAIIKAAQESGKFFMEALWTRFLPAYKKFKSIRRGQRDIKRNQS